MNAPCVVLSVIALALYVSAAACSGADLFLTAPEAPATPTSASSGSAMTLRLALFGRILLGLGVLVQVAATGLWCVTMRASPFAGEFGTLSILAWVMALAYAAFDLRFRMRAVGAVALPLTCLVLFWGLLHVG